MSDPFSWLSPTQTSPLKDRFPALEFVPCPGDPQASKHVATIVQRTAKSLDEISDALHGTDGADWKGQHADAFREQFDDDFRPKVDKAKRSFSKAASALTTWADEMPAWQRKAEVLEKQAQDAQDALRAARGKLSDLPPKPLLDLPPKDDADAREQEKTEKDRAAARLAASTAESDLDRIRAQARKLATDYDLEGRSVARRLDKAMNIAPNEPGLLDKIGDTLVDIGKALGAIDDIVADAVKAAVADAVKWLSEHAYSIAALGDVLAAVSAALGAISLVIILVAPITGPLAPAFATAAGAVGVASGAFALGALGLHGTARAVGGDSVVSNRTLAQDALGVLPFGGAFKGVSKAVSASRAADAAANFGLVDTVAAFIADPTALGYFKPVDDRQTVQSALPGGNLLVAFENAWKVGSEKDKAARQGE
ncbi:WXG100 family type VII secretion target [Streptomyces sp. NPDC057074]|uniref:WXG100 family type VII secretion target n=1 Tax=Streptomyces sp. NPDC057074 TaxID=3346015 RepID=UPI003627642D